MKIFNNLKLKVKILSGFLIMAIIVSVIGVIGMINLNTVDKNDTKLYEKMTVPMDNLYNMVEAYQRIRGNLRDMILSSTPAQLTDYETRIKARKDIYDKNFVEFKKTLLTDSGKSACANLDTSMANYQVLVNQIIALAKENKDEQALTLLWGDAEKAKVIVEDSMAKLTTMKVNLAKTTSDDNATTADNARNLMLGLIVGGILLAVAIGLLISKSITKPVNQLVDYADRISLGDVDIEIDNETTDEIGILMSAFKKMIGNIKEQVQAVEKIASGDLNVTLEVKSEKDVLGKNLISMAATVKELLSETSGLIEATQKGKLDTRGNAAKFDGSWSELIGGVNELIDAFVGPINVTAEYVDRISKGDIPPKITDNYNGDFNEIKNNLNSCIDVMNGLLVETNGLIKATQEGKLDTRGNADQFNGGWGELIAGVNKLIDAFVGPINVTAEYVDRISKGDIPPVITDTYNGDFNEIKNNLNSCIDVMNGLLTETNKLIKATQEGKLDTRGNADQFNGGWSELIVGVNELIDAFVGPINVTAEYVDRISKGDIPPVITDTYNGDFNEIKNNLNSCIDVMKGLLTETNKLIKATQEGKLDTRGNASLFNGDWGELIVGVNEMIDAFVRPINVTSDYVDKIGKGNIPAKITDTYNGDFNVIKNNLNACIENINALVADANMLSQAAVEGKLSTRADASKHSGDYQLIIAGVNSTLDSVIGPLNVTAEYVDKIGKGDIPAKITDSYNGDFNEIKNNLNSCIDSINLLVSDASSLVASAVEGKLSTRADASKHSGDFKKIVEGVNKTLDAVIEPVKEASAVLQEMANGNLKVRVKGDYRGDHADIKNALNETLEALGSYVNEISEVLGEMSNSNLEVTINNEYKGDFSQIKDALNFIIQSFNEVFTEINNAADQVSSGSNQVSDGSQALSQGTTEQASAIEELTSSITEVAAQTKQNAVNATQANDLALNAKDGATQGNAHMKEMLKSMDEINESSSNISKIIKVIDDIAFQTNILALNAAVEAARAGQHGKGFAVVAEEVRNLAARSASAAKETTDLIEGSIKKVEVGTRIANNTATALDQIVEGVSKAATLVGEIAAASNEQATSISQINKGIEQVSDVVQTNSATAEQSAAASEELSSQASMLKEMVGKFKLKRGGASAYRII